MRFSKTTGTFTLFLALLFSCSIKDEKSLSRELEVLSEELNPIQLFEIKPDQDTTLIGLQGTKVFFKSNSLVYENENSVNSSIEVRLKEVYTISEMVLNRLTTTSNGELLQTSGMVNITASSEGRAALKLKSGSELNIRFVKISEAPYMRAFLGAFDSTVINWNLDKDAISDTLKFKVRRRNHIR